MDPYEFLSYLALASIPLVVAFVIRSYRASGRRLSMIGDDLCGKGLWEIDPFNVRAPTLFGKIQERRIGYQEIFPWGGRTIAFFYMECKPMTVSQTIELQKALHPIIPTDDVRCFSSRLPKAARVLMGCLPIPSGVCAFVRRAKTPIEIPLIRRYFEVLIASTPSLPPKGNNN
jgi:hypothetical protein